MAFEGDLQNIQLSDIFQSLAQNQQSGTLVVRTGDMEKRFSFGPRGVAALSRRTLSGSRLGEFLVGRGLITEQDLKQSLQQQRRSGHALGRVLVERGVVDPRYVEDVLRYHAAEEIYDVFGWGKGQFNFIEGETAVAPGEASPFASVHFDPGGIILEAARRVDEWERIRAAFPSDHDFLVRDRELENGEIDNQDVLNLLELIDGTREIATIAREFYLSSFDLRRSLRELLEAGIIRRLDWEELKLAAGRLVERDEVLRAISMLECAWELAPQESALLELLAEACRSSGDDGATARWLVELAKLRYGEGNIPQATARAREALDADEGNLAAVEILCHLALKAGELDEAIELTCRRVSILRKQRDYRIGAQVCEEALSIPGCESLMLRLHHATCLNASRDPGSSLLAYERAAKLAREQGRSAELGEIYQSILRIDEDHAEARQHLQDLGRSERVRRHRRVLLIGAAAAVLVLASVGLLTGGDSGDLDARIGEVQVHIRRGELEKASRLLIALDTEVAGDEDLTVQVSNLRAELARRTARTRVNGSVEANELANLFDPHLEEATTLFEAGRVSRALDRLSEAVSCIGGEVGQRLSRKNAKLFAKIRSDDLKEIERRAVHGIESTIKLLQEDREFVDSVRKQELIRTGQDLETKLERMLGILNRKLDLEAIEADVVALGKSTGQPRRLDAAFRVLSEECGHLGATMASATAIRHVIEAQLLRPQMLRRYRLSMTQGRALRDRGMLEKSRKAFSDLLDYFRAIEAREPSPPFASLVALIREQGLWPETEASLTEVEDTLETLARARLFLEGHQFAQAQRLYLDLLEKHEVIDFREHIHLPLHLTSRPSGADVFVNDRLEGRTPLTLALPYGTRSEVRLALSTFHDRIISVAGSSEPGPAVQHVDLDKVPRWVVETGGPLGRCVARIDRWIVAAARDGSIQVFDPVRGARTGRIETGFLEGFATDALVIGDHAWLLAANGKVLRLDCGTEYSLTPHDLEGLARRGASGGGSRFYLVTDDAHLVAFDDAEERWRVPVSGRILDAPLVTGGRVIFGSTTGRVTAVSSATGATLWNQDLGAIVRHSPHLSMNRVLVGQDAGLVVALDLESGRPIWNRRIESPVTTRIATHFGILHVGALDGHIHRLSESNGNPVDRIEVGDSISTDLVIHDGLLYIGTRGGRACAFDLNRGSLLWSFDLGSAAVGCPILIDSAVVFASRGGRIVAFE